MARAQRARRDADGGRQQDAAQSLFERPVRQFAGNSGNDRQLRRRRNGNRLRPDCLNRQHRRMGRNYFRLCGRRGCLRGAGNGHRLCHSKATRLRRGKADHQGQEVQKQPHQFSPAGDIGGPSAAVHPVARSIQLQAFKKVKRAALFDLPLAALAAHFPVSPKPPAAPPAFQPGAPWHPGPGQKQSARTQAHSYGHPAKPSRYSSRSGNSKHGHRRQS